MNTTTETTLELFQFTKPESQFPVGMTTSKQYENGSLSVTMALEKRKDAAKRLGLTGNALTSALLGLSDKMKAAATGEFVKLAASDEWTGGRFVVRQSKNGQKKRATLSLVSVQRQAQISQEDVVKALASMTEDQQVAILEKAEELARTKRPVELEATAA
jgi:hypothetical protein